MNKYYKITLLVFLLSLTKISAQNIESVLLEKSCDKVIEKRITFNYLLRLPDNYTKDKQWPLIIYLHGSAQRGNNLDLVKKIGLMPIVEMTKNLPFVVIAPQCPTRSSWELNVDNLEYFFDEIIKIYSIDKRRIYLTGFSNGASGVYLWAVKSPERFAAIIPVSGPPPFTSYYPYRLKNVPIWAFQGELEDSTFLSRQVGMINSLREIGASPIFTIIPGGGHDPLPAYMTAELYTWIASQIKPIGTTYRWTAAPSLEGNTTFRLKGYSNASVVALAGSFNDWNENSLIFAKEGDEWVCHIDLKPGKYQYKFVIDGEWITDPANPKTEGEGLYINSVIIVK